MHWQKSRLDVVCPYLQPIQNSLRYMPLRFKNKLKFQFPICLSEPTTKI